MTHPEIERALQTGFNKQGRRVSESMRIKYLTTLAEPRPELTRIDYKGFVITGREHYYVADWPVIFPSLRQAKEAVDRCLALRAELASHD